MVRLVKLTSGFLAHRAACRVIRPSRATEALGRAIASLSHAETLPEQGDATTLLDPDHAHGVAALVYVRRVRGQNLWIWYRDAGTVVELVALTNQPPGP
jgi:hypothetical protein